jgi:hypothetical protein
VNILNIDLKAEEISPNHEYRFRIYPIGDPHLDDAGCDWGRLKKYIALIADDPAALWIQVGDSINGTTPSHRFFEAASIKPDILLRMDDYLYVAKAATTAVFAPLKDTVGIWMTGNHGGRQGGTLWSGFDRQVADELGVAYGGYEHLTRLNIINSPDRGKAVRVIYGHHGAGGGMLPGGKVWRWERDSLAIAPHADFYIRGHVHDSFYRVLGGWDVNRRGEPRLVEREKVFITTPSFKRSRTQNVVDYANRKGYRPTDERIKYVEVTLKKRKVAGTSNWHFLTKEIQADV